MTMNNQAMDLFEEIYEELKTIIKNFPGEDDSVHLHEYRKNLLENTSVIYHCEDLKKLIEIERVRLKAVGATASLGRDYQIKAQAHACFSVALKKIDHRLSLVDHDKISAEVQSLPTYGLF